MRSWIRHWAGLLIGLGGTTLLTIAGVSPHAMYSIGRTHHSSRPPLIALGLVMTGVGAILHQRRQRRLDGVVRDLEQARHEASAGALGLLRLVREDLDALRREAHHFSNERVSLYRWDGEQFILLARRSARPQFDRSPGSRRYSEQQGLLGKAWRDGQAYEAGLPPAGSAPPWNRSWIAAQCRYGLSETEAEHLTMPSRSYAAFRIEGPRRRSEGVLVFESVNSASEAEQSASPAELDFDRLKDVQDAAAARLGLILEESRFIDAERVSVILAELAG